MREEMEMKAKTKNMMKRLTGFSLPIVGGGLQWDPPALDRDEVKKLLAFLEDRRALFNPMPMEVEDHVISSLHSIRSECTKTVGQLSDASQGQKHVRAIGAACRRFMDDPYPKFDDLTERRRHPRLEEQHSYGHMRHGTDPAAFFTALGELRAFVGTQIASLAALYEIEVEGDLARILPPVWEDE